MDEIIKSKLKSEHRKSLLPKDEIWECIYRYRDLEDMEIKYIGITKNGLSNRHYQHERGSKWCKEGVYVLEYFTPKEQTDFLLLENELINYYETYRYFNKSFNKIDYIPIVPFEYEWIIAPFDTVDYWIKQLEEHRSISQVERYSALIAWYINELNRTYLIQNILFHNITISIK